MANEEQDAALLPCPFCGAGETQITPRGRVWMGTKYGEPISVSVRHWCSEVAGQPSRRIERVGRDEESAIRAWNARAAPTQDAVDAARLREALFLALARMVYLATREHTHGAKWDEALKRAGAALEAAARAALSTP